ncbi:MAG: uroporphyrinogen-III decarboxylase-like protein [Armatimonadetes bacterium]|nr:uroporphyrinogen-III decarboxylase-like protein [Armatimonadota bacterium]
MLSRRTPDRVPFVELFIDTEVLGALREDDLSMNPAERARETAEVYYWLGFDYVPAATDFAFPYPSVFTTDTAGLSRGRREWVNEAHGAIETWEQFEKYQWPTPGSAAYAPLERAAAVLPEGMKLIPHGPGGVLENVMWLMGYEPMSYAMVDQPKLVAAVFDRVGETLVEVFDGIAREEAVGAVFLGDDMGFKTQTMISPEDLRKYVFPWQRRLAEVVHSHGKPFLLHSCGNVESVMNELIAFVGIDAKHSFEDVILPVEEVKRRWGDRVAILGGVDVDLLTRGTPDQVRQRTREVLAACMPGGGYALGTGNSVANYIPVENYLALLEEGWRAGVYR